jgi:hypothetical protein
MYDPLSSLRMDQMVLKTYSDLILIISRKKYHLKQESQTQIYQMVIFQRKMLRGPQFIIKMLPRAEIYKKSSQNMQN